MLDITEEEAQEEIEWRIKLLYGVRDVKKLILKSQDSFKNGNEDDPMGRPRLGSTSANMSTSSMKLNNSVMNPQSSQKKLRSCRDYVNPDNFIISHRSRWKMTWDFFMLVVVAYSIFYTLLAVSFAPTLTEEINIINLVVTICFAIDLFLTFFQEYQDQETFKYIRDHKEIAKRYLKSTLLIDVVATIPFELFSEGEQGSTASVTKLLRLTRLTRLWALMDQSKMNRILKQAFENSQRQDRIVAQYFLMYSFKIIRLIIIAIIITFTVGCVWYLWVSQQNKAEDIANGNTFLQTFGIDKIEDTYTKMIISCYFALTTLSTVGYGDLFPISDTEMIGGILVMMIGIVFFSHIMGSFIEIISNYDKRMNSVDRSTELHNWMTLLTRFTNNKPLPKNLINQIDNHYAFYWANDRLSALSKDDEFLRALPRSIKRIIIKHYLFDDIFYRFRLFFNTQENKDSKFLYDVAFGLRPRKYDNSEDERLILDEEDEVSEMYFVQEGIIGIGFYLMTQGLSKKQYKLGIYMRPLSFICDYYVCYNKKSEFIFMVVQEVKAFSLSKKMLLQKIFPRYPYIAATIKKGCSDRYKKNVRQRLLKYREEHIMEINKKSSYKNINIILKNDPNKLQGQSGAAAPHGAGGAGGQTTIISGPAQSGGAAFSSQQEIKMSKNESDLNQILKKRIEGIQQEMSKFNHFINDFAMTADNELINLVGNINLLQRNIAHVNEMKANKKKKREQQLAENFPKNSSS